MKKLTKTPWKNPARMTPKREKIAKDFYQFLAIYIFQITHEGISVISPLLRAIKSIPLQPTLY